MLRRKTLLLFYLLMAQALAKVYLPFYNVAKPADDYKDKIPKFNCAVIDKSKEKEVPLCSCVIIDTKDVLTVGSCLKEGHKIRQAKHLYVRTATFNVSRNSVETNDIQAIARTVHASSGIKEYKHSYDIAAIYLSEKIVFDNYVGKAQLPKDTTLYQPSTKKLWVLSNYRVEHKPQQYRDAIWTRKSTFINRTNCIKLLPKEVNGRLDTCASYFHEGSSGCKLDYGSALSYKNVLIGLLAYKEDCGSPNSTAVFVNVGTHKHWITERFKYFKKRHFKVKTKTS